MNEFTDATAALEAWASCDAERNFKLTHEYSRLDWVEGTCPDGTHRYSCEIWDPRNGAWLGSGPTIEEAVRRALSEMGVDFVA